MKCIYCHEEIEDDELENLGDIGCPSCRRTFDLTDFQDEDEPTLIPPYIDDSY